MTSAPPPAPPTADPPAWEPPPPPPPGLPPRSQLRRSSTDKMLGGVSGGLARYSGIDPLLWRVGFVALTLAGGSGVLVYLLLWLLMPADDAAPGERRTPLAGVADRRAAAGPRSPVPGLTMAGLLIVIGVLVLITRFTGWDVSARGFLGGALLVVGLGLVAAAFTGGRRARGGLIALGVVLSLALIAASTGPWRLDGGIGDRTYRPHTAADVRPLYDGGVGDLTLDLSGVPLSDTGSPIQTRVEHGVGDLEVLVPQSADVRVTVQHGLGDVDLFDETSSDGGYFPGTGSAAWTDDGDPEFLITIDAGVGDVEVSRA
jgi:phage shock protein PspC (stress-responsive transcriptional regulator)